MDPEVVREAKKHKKVRASQEGMDPRRCVLCGNIWPCPTAALFADWERRGEALREVLDFLKRASSGPKEIVSTGLLTEQQIANYRAAGLMYVEPGGGLGWVVRERRVLEMAEHDRDRFREALRQIEREGKSASDVWALRCASVARAALEGKP